MSARWLLVGAVGCGSGSGKDNVPPPPDPIVGAPVGCGFADPAVGTIDVGIRNDVFHTAPFARIEAVLYEGPIPGFHAVVAEQGVCRHLKASPTLCDPACTGGELCTVDATCLPFPGTIAGGELRFDGLAAEVVIEGASYSPGTYHGPGSLPAALFALGEPVSAWLAGDELPPIELEAVGVEPMEGTLADSGFTATDGTDAVVSWTAGPDPDACVRLVLYGANVLHGAPIPDLVTCETTDTGSLTVASDLFADLPVGQTLEVTEGYDWPHSTLTRYRRSRAETDVGPVELLVHGTTSFLLEHLQP